jgi:hypothetical protein
MCGIPAELNPQKSDAFAQQMLTVINHAGLALMISIGHRVKLFDVMAGLEWVNSSELAEAAGLNERYVREWLGAALWNTGRRTTGTTCLPNTLPG